MSDHHCWLGCPTIHLFLIWALYLLTTQAIGLFGGNWSFSSMPPRVAKGRQRSPRVYKVQGGPQGWVRWVITRSIIFKSVFLHDIQNLAISPLKSPEIPIKNEKWPLTPSYRSIILKIVLWAHFTITHAVLRGSSDFLKNPYFGTGHCSITVYSWECKWIIKIYHPPPICKIIG